MYRSASFHLNNNSRISRALAAVTLFVALAAQQGAASAQAQNSYADVVSRVTPAVVTIRASRISRTEAQR